MKSEAVIIGYSGHSYVVLDMLVSSNFKIQGYCEVSQKLLNPYNLEYLGSERNPNVIDLIRKFAIFLGIGDNHIRSKIFKDLQGMGLNMPKLIHDNAYVSEMTKIGVGTVIMPGSVINSCSIIGKCVVCNSASVIEHECQIDDFVHIAPGAVLAANVRVGKRSFIGANAVVIQGINIGSDVVVGAGAVVVNDIPNGAIVYGNPARLKSK